MSCEFTLYSPGKRTRIRVEEFMKKFDNDTTLKNMQTKQQDMTKRRDVGRTHLWVFSILYLHYNKNRLWSQSKPFGIQSRYRLWCQSKPF